MVHPFIRVSIIADVQFSEFKSIFIVGRSNTTAESLSTVCCLITNIILQIAFLCILIMLAVMPFEFPFFIKWVSAISLLFSANLQSKIFGIPTCGFLVHTHDSSPGIPFILWFGVESAEDILPPVWHWSASHVITISALHGKSIHIKFVLIFNFS